MAVFNSPPPGGRPVAFPRVSEQPALHFLSVRRQTGPESRMKRCDGGRARQRERGRREERARISLLPLSLLGLNQSKVSLMGYSVDRVLPPLVLSHLPSFDMLMFYLPGWK